MECEVSPLYGSDNYKNLHFYCEFCEKEMDYEEKRECTAEREKCACGEYLGTSNFAVSKCFNCDKDIC